MNKKGFSNILIVFTIFIIISIIVIGLFIIYMFQINFEVYKVKKDLFYIIQNTYISLDKEELKYNRYVFDIDNMRKNTEELLSKNLINDTNIEIEKFEYKNNIVSIVLNIKLKPIIKFINNEINIRVKENIKVKLMEVNNE